MSNSLRKSLAAAIVSLAAGAVAVLPATAQDKPPAQSEAAKPTTATTDPSKRVIAKVNGKTITEADLLMAEQEIGRDLGQLPPTTKRFALTEFLIENQLMADEAEKAKLASGKDFEDRLAYWRRRALRETFFEKKLKTSVSDDAARAFYEDKVKLLKPEEEVQARHILVQSEEDAQELSEQIARGEDFAKLAKAKSQDPGTKENGGMLGYFSKGQMVPAFEKTAFSLKKGEVSQPVKSKFGWHLVKLEDRRTKPVPKFEQVKEQILNSLVYQRQQALTDRLRKQANVVYEDPIVKREVKARDDREKLKEQLIKEQIKRNEAEKKAKEAVDADKKATP